MGRITRRNAPSNPSNEVMELRTKSAKQKQAEDGAIAAKVADSTVRNKRSTRLTRSKLTTTLSPNKSPEIPATKSMSNPLINREHSKELLNCSVRLKQLNLSNYAISSPRAPSIKVPQIPLIEPNTNQQHSKSINFNCSVRLKQTNLNNFAISTPKVAEPEDVSKTANSLTTLHSSQEKGQSQKDKTKSIPEKIDAVRSNIAINLISPKLQPQTRTSARRNSIDYTRIARSIISPLSTASSSRTKSRPAAPINLDPPQSHVPIYKLKPKAIDLSSTRQENNTSEKDLSVFDYFSNSQEFPDQEADQNRQIITKLKQQNKIKLIKKKTTKKAIQKKNTGRVQKKETIALKKLKDNLIAVLNRKEKQKTVSFAKPSEKNKSDHNMQSSHDLADHMCERLELEIIQSPTNTNQSFAKHDHSRLSLNWKPNQQSTPFPKSLGISKQKSFSLTTPSSSSSTPIRTNTSKKTTNPIAARSPWRFTEEIVPKTCYYATSSVDQLPSFSSDLPINSVRQPISIASTSSHSLRADSNKLHPKHDTNPALSKPTSPVVNRSNISNQLEDSLNLSNIENIQPNSPSNSNPEDKSNRLLPKLILGERNTNVHRSPLRPLIISNVLLSPPRQHLQKSVLYRVDASSGKPTNSIVSSNPLAAQVSTISKNTDETRKSGGKSLKPDTIESCFGFDSDSEIEDDLMPHPNTQTVYTNMLKLKMQELQRLLPSPSAGPSRVVPIASRRPNLFAQPESSRRANAQLFPKNVEPNTLVGNSSDNVHASGMNSSDSFDCVRWGSDVENQEACPALFETLWPEKDKPTRRSYTRIPKRKRNMYSEDEDSDEEPPETKRKKTTKRRKDKDAAAAAKELEKFANEFQEECELIEQFELVMDKSSR